MIDVLYTCITEQHDWRLVVLAAIICTLASCTVFVVLSRVTVANSGIWSNARWFAAAAFVAGSGIWATHFVAMLAFRPGVPVAYDISLTILSVAIAIAVSGLGLFVAVSAGWHLFGGGIVGTAVASMHYTGMMALRVPASLTWDPSYVVASVVFGTVFAAVAVVIALRSPSLKSYLTGGSVLALAIAGLHFLGMSALRVVPDPLVNMTGEVMAPDLLAVVVAAVVLLIITVGLAGSNLDFRLTQRAEDEAKRLRRYVVELEDTKRALEARTDEVTAALETVEASSQAKSRFLAAMNHELRTPLNAIIGFAEVQARELHGPAGDPRYVEYANHICESGHHLLKVINDILDYANLLSDGIGLCREEVSPTKLVTDSANSVRDEAERAGIRLVVNTAPDMAAMSLDPFRMRQVLRSLLSNAVKFTPSGGQVTVTTRPVSDGCMIVVEDTGIGIASEDIPKALAVFGQVDSNLSRKYEGCGLGLPLAKLLVERHGGTFAIESVVGKGTRVTITLLATPRAAEHPSIAA
jgi:signal transduction histidine kinase